MSIRAILAFGFALGLAVPCLAQAPGAELPKLSNLAFGWVSMSGVDPTIDTLTSFAPNMLCLQDNGFAKGGEAATGGLVFNDLEVTYNIESAMAKVGPGQLRLVHYGFDSNDAEIPGLPGMQTSTSGDALELSYAQRFGNIAAGVSLVPQDETTITLANGGMTLAEGTVDDSLGGRAGMIAYLPHGVRLGANYSYQSDTGTMRLSPAATGAPDWITLQDDFITRCSTYGASWQATKKTQFYGAYQIITATGGNIGKRRETNEWFGMRHQLTPSLTLATNYLERSPNLMLGYRSKYGLITAAWTEKAIPAARSFLGEGYGAFISLSAAF